MSCNGGLTIHKQRLVTRDMSVPAAHDRVRLTWSSSLWPMTMPMLSDVKTSSVGVSRGFKWSANTCESQFGRIAFQPRHSCTGCECRLCPWPGSGTKLIFMNEAEPVISPGPANQKPVQWAGDQWEASTAHNYPRSHLSEPGQWSQAAPVVTEPLTRCRISERITARTSSLRPG